MVDFWWILGGFSGGFSGGFFGGFPGGFSGGFFGGFFCGPNTYVLICIWAQKKSTEKSTRKFTAFFRVLFSASWSLKFSLVGRPPGPTQEPPRLPPFDHYLHDLYSQKGLFQAEHPSARLRVAMPPTRAIKYIASGFNSHRAVGASGSGTWEAAMALRWRRQQPNGVRTPKLLPAHTYPGAAFSHGQALTVADANVSSRE